ncbi:hypothetical protein COD94_25275 [Bacillus cereus]|nr:hypothetical protein COD94_25275 [Bacillus cereus]
MRHIVYIEDDIEIGKEIKLGLEKNLTGFLVLLQKKKIMKLLKGVVPIKREFHMLRVFQHKDC